MHSITDLWQKQTCFICYNYSMSSMLPQQKQPKKKKRKEKKKRGKNVIFRNTQLYNFSNHFRNISANNGTVGWNDSSVVPWCMFSTLSQEVSDVPFALQLVLRCLNGNTTEVPTIRLPLTPTLLWILFFIVDLESLFIWVSVC